jgi:hypothetical protein
MVPVPAPPGAEEGLPMALQSLKEREKARKERQRKLTVGD